MKTATKLKPLSKVNEKIKELAAEIIEIESYSADDDFDTREKSICANIKVYEWIDEDDVLDIVKKHNIQAHEEDILEEFNEDRRNSIHNHTSEYEVGYLKEKHEDNVDLDNPYNEFKLYEDFYNNNFEAYPLTIRTYTDFKGKYLTTNKCYYENLVSFSERKNNKPSEFLKELKSKNKWSFDEWERRDLIDFECWQYGRSGGWFSICKTSELENQEFESYDFYSDVSYLEGIDNNDEFNEVLRDELQLFSIDKKKFISEMETFINNWKDKKAAIEYYVAEIENNKKYFKANLIERLEQEINDFIENDLNIEFSNCNIEIQENLIKTSLGVTIDLKEFTDAFKLLHSFLSNIKTDEKEPIKKHVGGYFVEYAKGIKDDVLIKAGCHKFSLKNIKQVLSF
jgi:hypothetical protein